jgi:ketosteroid isomerase-like protein
MQTLAIGGREMGRPVAVIFCAALLTMASAKWAEAQGDKQAVVQQAVVQTINDYFASFADLGPTFDIQRALSFFHEPSMLIVTARASTFPTRGDAEAGWVKSFVARQRERGYARQDVAQTHVKQMSAGVALASVEVVRYKADGQVLEHVGASYVLRKTNDGWKIAVVTAHDPGNVLRLE